MMDAIETFPASFFLYDSDDKLVTSNTAAKLAYPSAVAAMIPGTSRLDIIKATGESELINSIGDEIDASGQDVTSNSQTGKVISEIRRNDVSRILLCLSADLLSLRRKMGIRRSSFSNPKTLTCFFSTY